MNNAPKLTMPTRSLLEGMPYTTAVSTNIRALFERIRQQKKRKHDSVPKVKT